MPNFPTKFSELLCQPHVKVVGGGSNQRLFVDYFWKPQYSRFLLIMSKSKKLFFVKRRWFNPPTSRTPRGQFCFENFVGKLGISAFRFFLVEIDTSVKKWFSGANKMENWGILKIIENVWFLGISGFTSHSSWQCVQHVARRTPWNLDGWGPRLTCTWGC